MAMFWLREAMREWPIALAREVSAWESTITLAFHPWRMGFGMGYWKRGTLWDLAGGGGNSSVVMMGRCRVPMTPRWYRKAV
jgi:hypothetical protein